MWVKSNIFSISPMKNRVFVMNNRSGPLKYTHFLIGRRDRSHWGKRQNQSLFRQFSLGKRPISSMKKAIYQHVKALFEESGISRKCINCKGKNCSWTNHSRYSLKCAPAIILRSGRSYQPHCRGRGYMFFHLRVRFPILPGLWSRPPKV